ncbi:MAG: hypothetical protein LLG04_08670 [Parachlamydia sp.]|nr:hypothetical protein [Parachlamydia sp.]
MMPMSRWVERSGCKVTFGNVIMGFIGKPYIYEFPDEEMAKKFQKFISKKDKAGNPRGVPEKHWAKPYWVHHGGI